MRCASLLLAVILWCVQSNTWSAPGQQMVVDNRGGGGQIIATELTAKAPRERE